MAIMFEGMFGRVRDAVFYILHGEMPKPVQTDADSALSEQEWDDKFFREYLGWDKLAAYGMEEMGTEEARDYLRANGVPYSEWRTISTAMVSELARTGKLDARKVSNRWKMTQRSLDNFLGKETSVIRLR